MVNEDVFLLLSGQTVFTRNVFSGWYIHNGGHTLLPTQTILIIIALINRGRYSESYIHLKKTKVEKYILCLRLCSYISLMQLIL